MCCYNVDPKSPSCSGVIVMILKIFSSKNLQKKLAIVTKITTIGSEKITVTLVFKKKGKNSGKIEKTRRK
jgi:hypothetical protein